MYVENYCHMKPTYILRIDFKQAHDIVKWRNLFQTLSELDIGERIRMIKNYIKENR